jgi:tRNA threonylcarbamoyladenosine biosynthesis protein TsaE
MLTLKSNSEQETHAIGYKLGTLLKKGDVVCLDGDLGVGKTVFTKGIALGLQVEEYVTSPTFTLIHEYLGRLPLYHFDVYRINSIEEMEDLGYEEYFYGSGVCIVEWASKIKELIPEEHLWIDIKRKGDNQREIAICGTMDHFSQVIKELKRK